MADILEWAHILKQKGANTASKQLRSTRKLNKPVEFDALVPFMKVWGSNSIGKLPKNEL